jgi:hypothetical protein
VWSGYGSGYGFVPFVLPVFGLLWLRYWAKRARNGRTVASAAAGPGEAAGGSSEKNAGVPADRQRG